MPINRAPYDALVDDDGSNTTGSVWNKQAIKNVLLDPIDVSLAAVTDVWNTVPYNAADFFANTGTWTVEAGDVGTFAYNRVGKTMMITLQLSATSVSGSPTQLRVRLPGGAAVGQNCTAVIPAFDGASWGAVFMSAGVGVTFVNLMKDPGANGTWPTTTNSTYVYGTFIVPLL